MTDDDKDLKDPTTQGGPRYPFIGLPEAVERAKVFFQEEKKNPAPVAAAVKHWGYADKSSGGRQTVAALIHFGLLRDEGSSEQRRIMVTPLALDLLLHPEGSADWLEAARTAAKSPKLFADLMSKYQPHELPSDSTLRHYLVAQRSLNPSVVDTVLKNFKATLKFARLDSSDTLPPIKPPVDDPSKGSGVTTLETPQVPPMKPGAAMKQDVFSLEEGNVVLQWPSQMSPASYEDFKSWVELQLRKISRTVQ